MDGGTSGSAGAVMKKIAMVSVCDGRAEPRGEYPTSWFGRGLYWRSRPRPRDDLEGDGVSEFCLGRDLYFQVLVDILTL